MSASVLSRLSATAIAVVGAASASAVAQTLGPDFVNDYTVTVLPPIPGVPAPYGGTTFKAGDPNKLLVVGESLLASAAIYEITVTRDANGCVDGYTGSATTFASAPLADGGLRYGPNGVLLYTTWPTNTLSQIKPGSGAPDKVLDLTPLGVTPSTGGLGLTPSGFPGAGKLRITTYDFNEWYSADLVPDGMGTFDLATVAGPIVVPFACPANQFPNATPLSVIYVDSTLPAFAGQEVLVCNWDCQTVGAYPIDAAGDIVPSVRREFFSDFQCSGSVRDPVTGSWVFPAYPGFGVAVVKRLSVPVGTPFECPQTVTNSSGNAATISATGSEVAADNDVTLTATGMPTSNPTFGYFLNSMAQNQAGFVPPGSQGRLCIGPGGVGRYNTSVFNATGTGEGSLVLDLTQTPTPSGSTSIQAGETWYFTAWFRDVNPNPTSNFTDGLCVTFL